MADALSERLERVARELDSRFAGDVAHIRRGENAVELRIRRHKGKTVALEVFLAAQGLPELLLRAETGTDRLGKRLGVNREFYTGDPDFDAGVYIESNYADEVLGRVLAGKKLRDAALLLLKAGAEHLKLSPKGLSLRLAGKPLNELDAVRCGEILDALLLASSALPELALGELPPPRKSPGTMVIVTTVVLIFAGLLAVGLAVSQYEPLDAAPYGTGALLGFGALALLFPFTGRYLKGYSDSFRNLIILNLALLFALPIWGMALAVGGNGYLDSSPALAHTVAVVRQYTTRNKNSTSYHLQLQSWRPGEPYIHLSVSSSFYQGKAPGKFVTLRTKKGYWGWEWLASYS